MSAEPRVVIAGGGVAGLECLIALREHVGNGAEITLVTPEDEFVYRPMRVLEPFNFAAAQRYPVARIAADHGATLKTGSISWVDPEHRVAHTAAGEQLGYDAIVLALGARCHDRYQHALTVDDRRLDETMHGLVQDVELGYSRSVAFVMPSRIGWPLPLYELALLTATRAREMCVDVALTIVTPEQAPLAIFGDEASGGVSRLLLEAGIVTICSAYAEVPHARRITIAPGDRRLDVDRIVALPLLMGPSLRGLPVAPHGFIPVAPDGAVRDVAGVYAAGDGTDFPVKHGGIAAEQADVAAASVAAALGFPVARERFEPIVRGMLLTGHAPLYLTASLIGGKGFTSTLSETCPWSPPTKIAAKHLSRYLEHAAVAPAPNRAADEVAAP